MCLGTYGLLDTTTPRLLGTPTLAVGVLLSAAGLALGGRRIHRTRYRPDPWGLAEWLTALSGVVAAVAMIVAGTQNASALNPSLFPLSWPALPVLPVIAILCALLPAVLTPPPPFATVSAASHQEPVPSTRPTVGAHA